MQPGLAQNNGRLVVLELVSRIGKRGQIRRSNGIAKNGASSLLDRGDLSPDKTVADSWIAVNQIGNFHIDPRYIFAISALRCLQANASYVKSTVSTVTVKISVRTDYIEGRIARAGKMLDIGCYDAKNSLG